MEGVRGAMGGSARWSGTRELGRSAAGGRPQQRKPPCSGHVRARASSLLGAALLAVLLAAQLPSGAHAAASAAAKAAASERGGDYAAAANYSALRCQDFDATYPQIDADLEVHRNLGTHLNATKYIAAYLGSAKMRGLTVGFFGGRAYLLTPTDFPGLSHHAKLHAMYIRQLLHLEDTFGRHLPDVAFVLTTSDTPRYCSTHLLNTSSPQPYNFSAADCHHTNGFVPGPYPVMGIGKSDWWPDLLLVPNFHFHMKLYDNTSLALVEQFAEVPWAKRKPVLFGRFSKYRMNRSPDDASTNKLGVGGKKICYNGGKTCPTREYFIRKMPDKDPDRIDVSFRAKVPMLRHTEYKYLINLEGQGISSRLEQLLPMGSAVFKEASGYYAYYYRTLLKHRVNIIEFWRKVPEEVLEELDWAAGHDGQVAEVAAQGVATAVRYLVGPARACYWYRLLHGLAGALAYTPDLSQWPAAVPLRQVLEEQMPRSPQGREAYEQPWAP
ncbi:hypothetical protein HYH02_001266 [Chlamydomonas schloesseri]|uniref:Glycosyl transferase CAP10 domain-containing protein n=1 Tax=Chlamydomonas schloesseri TaxID=2026947 RepID=A0A835WVK8_9CHLO|nr:hypothetical protein HYH02_001266 [Chlamydomonas schloesseri]|eukprot:KAG2454232.1 hypothetical protein HYH02_001266 [Chlamydomonas schloesseri]